MNTIKHKIEGKPVSKWAQDKGANYGYVVSLLNKGVPEEEIVKICKERYYIPRPADEAAQVYTKMIKEAKTNDASAKAKEVFFDIAGNTSHAVLIWNRIMRGRYKPKELWRQAKDSKTYQVSSLGNFRRITKNGNTSKLNPYEKQYKNKDGEVTRRVMSIKIDNKEQVAARVIAEAFNPKLSHDHTVVTHKNEDHTDLRPSNLRWTMKKDVSSVTNAMEVVHTDEDGITTTYPSAREASRELNISYQTILDYCKGNVKDPMVNVKFKK